MELGGRAGKLPRIEADIVAGDQRAIAVKRRVLDGLGAKRRAQLLEMGKRAILQNVRREPLSGKPFTKPGHQPLIARQTCLPGAPDRSCQDGTIRWRSMIDPRVNAIDGKMSEDFRQGAADRRARKIARGETALRDRIEGLDDGIALGGKTSLQDLPPRQFFLGGEIGGPAADAVPQLGQRSFAGRVVLQSADLVHEIVAGGAVGLPGLRQCFIASQNFFNDKIGRSGRCMWRPLFVERAQPRPQLAAIGLRLRQPVDVVDAQAVNQAVGIKPKCGGVDRFENFVVLDAHRGKLIDIEETTPIDLIVGGAPPCQPVVLPFQQFMQSRPPLRCRRIEVAKRGTGGEIAAPRSEKRDRNSER